MNFCLKTIRVENTIMFMTGRAPAHVRAWNITRQWIDETLYPSQDWGALSNMSRALLSADLTPCDIYVSELTH